MAEQGAARPSCDKSRERRDGRATERKARAMHTAARIDRRKEEGKVRVRERDGKQPVGDLAVGVKSSIVIKEGLCEGW